MKRLFAILSLSLMFAASLNAATPNHQLWEALLQKHVNYQAGTVNYKGFKADKAKLDAYLTELETHTPQSDWSRNQKLAYWINVYNAYTIKLIVDNYPLKSIRDLDKPWDRKFIKLGGTSYSLNQVENDILRKYTSKIHFAVNCASISCPPLYHHAFTADNVNSYLNRLTRNFLTNPKRTVVSGSSVKVSKIFDWYSADFKTDGSIIPYLNKYLDPDLPANAEVSYLDYNWNLNQ